MVWQKNRGQVSLWLLWLSWSGCIAVWLTGSGCAPSPVAGGGPAVEQTVGNQASGPQAGVPPGGASAPSGVFPGEEWDVEAPERHGLEQALLQQTAAEVQGIGGRQCFLVIKDGVIVHESYYTGDKETLNGIASVTKSFGSTLLGIAATQGLLDVGDLVARWVPAHSPRIQPSATLRHLLSHTSESNPPGKGFFYDSDEVINTLPAALSAAAGMTSPEFARKYLVEPLSLRHFEWQRDNQGNLLFGYGIQSTCRDVARLGLLYLHKGNWNGRPIVSPGYVEAATRPPFPEANSGYGYLWWLNSGQGTWRRPLETGNGKMLGDAPESLFMGTGIFGQLLVVLPESRAVLVTLGSTPDFETLNTVRKLWKAVSPLFTPAP